MKNIKYGLISYGVKNGNQFAKLEDVYGTNEEAVNKGEWVLEEFKNSLYNKFEKDDFVYKGNTIFVKGYDDLYECSYKVSEVFVETDNVKTNILIGGDIVREENNHNKDLILQLNNLWWRNYDGFKSIMRAFWNRDFNEINVLSKCRWMNFPSEEDKGHEFMQLAEFYIKHVADDTDIEVMIKFLE